MERALPAVVHFLGSHTDRSPYTTEAIKLRRVMVDRWPANLARAYAALVSSVPDRASSVTKDLLRPVYRRVFGTRAVAPSGRV